MRIRCAPVQLGQVTLALPWHVPQPTDEEHAEAMGMLARGGRPTSVLVGEVEKILRLELERIAHREGRSMASAEEAAEALCAFRDELEILRLVQAL